MEQSGWTGAKVVGDIGRALIYDGWGQVLYSWRQLMQVNQSCEYIVIRNRKSSRNDLWRKIITSNYLRSNTTASWVYCWREK